nr:molybdopterin-guanine dinucleotide biosynthesis protein B [Thermosulfidibacter takaii]
MKAFAVVGPHNSGKTTLIRHLVKKFSEKGLSVAIIKSTKHTGIFEDPDKDTTLLLNTQAEKVILVAPDKTTIFLKKGINLDEILINTSEDIVICEGFKGSSLPKIAVFKEYEEEFWKGITNIVAVVSETPTNPWDVPRFDRNETDKIADFVTNYIPSWDREKVQLYVNNRKIELKPFLQRILKDSVWGFVKNLKGVDPSAKEVEIKIKITE